MVASDMDKGKHGRMDGIPHQRGSGGDIRKNPIEVNGTVNWGKRVGNEQRKLNFQRQHLRSLGRTCYPQIDLLREV